MNPSSPLHVHVLVDLEWQPEAGGQVLCWQNLARAAERVEGLFLTIHAQGAKEEKQPLHTRATLWRHQPVFSTRKVPLLQVPAHTDLAGYNPALAAALNSADVIHTTDGFFAYAKTAEKVARARGVPLTHSIHTDTVSYSRIFTGAFMKKNFGGLGEGLDHVFGIARGVEKDMARKLRRHESQCRFVLASREEDRHKVAEVLGPERAKQYRLGIDRGLFNPEKRNRAALCARYGIPDNAVIVMFVGRMDEGKNVMRLVHALATEIKRGAPFFLLAAGEGVKEEEIKNVLGKRVALAGFLSPEELARAYASSDWLAIPSMVETWSLVAAEALSCGLPVIAACGSGVGRFLGAEGAGLLVAEDIPVAWEKTLADACGLRDAETLRRTAHAAALAQFPSWEEALAKDFLPVWKEARG